MGLQLILVKKIDLFFRRLKIKVNLKSK